VVFKDRGIEIKTPEQIEKMRAAGLVVGRTLQLLRESARPGVTTLELDQIAEDSIRSSGATPSFKGYHGFTGSICASVNDEVVHGIPSRRRLLYEGDLIGLDYLCQSGREREGIAADEVVVRDGIVCYSPKSLTLTSVVVITGETARGSVAEVSIKGQLVGEDTEAARSQLAETMAKATFLVILDAEDAPNAGDFVLAHVPDLQLEAGVDAATGTFGSVQVSIRRQKDGAYLLLLRSSGA